MDREDEIDQQNEHQHGSKRDVTRQTVVRHQSKNESEIKSIIIRATALHNLDFHGVVSSLQKYPELKDQRQFTEELFYKPQLIKQMIQCILEPETIQQKYQIQIQQLKQYIKVIVAFMTRHFDFMEHFFIKVQGNPQIKKQNQQQNLTKQGNLQVKSSFEENLLSITYDMWFVFLYSPSRQSFDTSLAYLSNIFQLFVQYKYSTSSKVCDYFDAQYPQQAEQKSILIINLFPDSLLQHLYMYTHLKPIFNILFQLVIKSLFENEWKRSLQVLTGLCHSCIQQKYLSKDHVQNVYEMVNQVSENITNQQNNSIFAFTNAFVQAGLAEAALNNLLSFAENCQELSQMEFTWQFQYILQLNLKVLSSLVNIYSQLRINGMNRSAGQMIKLKKDIKLIFEKLPNIIFLSRYAHPHSLKLSNGENAKMVSMFRYQLLNLVKNCLQLSHQQSGNDHEMKLYLKPNQLFDMLEKAMSMNRWNNIMQCMVQKIVYLFFTPQIFHDSKTEVLKFLKFIIQAFSNKKYVFLNSIRMISQGNLHSLYNISRIISIQFEKAQMRHNIKDYFQQWSLQVYEAKSLRKFIYQPDCEVQSQSDEKSEGFKVAIDQLESIKELVEKIQLKNKWHGKKGDRNSNPSLHKSESASSLKALRKTKDNYGGHQKKQHDVKCSLLTPDKFDKSATFHEIVSQHKEKKTMIQSFAQVSSPLRRHPSLVTIVDFSKVTLSNMKKQEEDRVNQSSPQSSDKS